MKRLDREDLLLTCHQYKEQRYILFVFVVTLIVICIILYDDNRYEHDKVLEYEEKIVELESTIDAYENKIINEISNTYFDTSIVDPLYYEYFDPIEITHTDKFQTLYDSNSGVMYTSSINGSMCPILHTCGCPKIWDKLNNQVTYHDTVHGTSE